MPRISDEQLRQLADNLKYNPIRYKYIEDFLKKCNDSELVEIAIRLKEMGFDVNTPNLSQIAHLVFAAGARCERIVKLLLMTGADVNKQDPTTGNTPLLAANMNMNIKIVEMLLQAGADVNIQNRNGFTPIYYAAKNGSTRIVRMLLENGAYLTVNTPNIVNDETPIFAAIYREKLLRGNSDRANALGIVKMFLRLQNPRVDVNVQDGHRFTPIHYAAKNKNREMVELFLRAGADLRQGRYDRESWKFIRIVYEAIALPGAAALPELPENVAEAAVAATSTAAAEAAAVSCENPHKRARSSKPEICNSRKKQAVAAVPEEAASVAAGARYDTRQQIDTLAAALHDAMRQADAATVALRQVNAATVALHRANAATIALRNTMQDLEAAAILASMPSIHEQSGTQHEESIAPVPYRVPTPPSRGVSPDRDNI